MKTKASKVSNSADTVYLCAQSASGDFSSHDTVNTTSGVISLVIPPDRSKAPHNKVADAVYGYIQALRALGHDRVSSTDIANALSLPLSDVNRAVMILRDKGVRVI